MRWVVVALLAIVLASSAVSGQSFASSRGVIIEVGPFTINQNITSGGGNATELPATNITAGAFAASKGGGDFSFPRNLTIGANLSIVSNVTLDLYSSCNLKTDANGNFVCGSDLVGGGADVLQLPADNITAGSFGSNYGGGDYIFPRNVTINANLSILDNVTLAKYVNCNLETNANGWLVCGTDDTGSGGADGVGYNLTNNSYLFGSVPLLDFNETKLNATISALDTDTIITSLPAGNITNTTEFSGNFTFTGNVTSIRFDGALDCSLIDGGSDGDFCADNNTDIFTDIDTDYGNEIVTSTWNFNDPADHEWSAVTYDLQLGDADEGQLRMGTSYMGQADQTISGTALDDIFIIYNNAPTLAENISFAFFGPSDVPRFVIPEEGADFATYSPRSMVIGPTATIANMDENILCSTMFENIDCDTDGTGADLGIEDDLEVEGTIFADGGVTGALTGNADTSTALAANGANCGVGEIPLGIDTLGAVEGCYEPAEADITDLLHTQLVTGLPADNITSLAYTTSLPAGNITNVTSFTSNHTFDNSIYVIGRTCYDVTCSTYIFNNGTGLFLQG